MTNDPGIGRNGPAVRGTRGVTRVRVELPKAGIVPTDEKYRYEATEFAENRQGVRGLYLGVRDRVLGTTLASHRLESERLSKLKALAVFSSDALSSTAYATQEIMFVLVLAGASALTYSLPIAIAITTLLTVVVVSYRQTVRAYPNGGGAYIVAHENFGVAPGLIAAASLLIDYVLTVAVSIASAMDALASLHSGFRPFAVEIAILVVAVVALVNLRGLRESGTIFAVPTYAFVVMLGLAIAVGVSKVFLNGENLLSAGPPNEHITATESITLFFLLRAFANGCTALTGVEAISNGVQAFKPPAWKNASQTLLAMGLLLGTLFMGLTLLARHHGFVPSQDNTIPSQLGKTAFGEGSILFFLLQITTAGILMLAANTSFADFPRLAAILARDGYMPRIFHARGNRLVFSYGIIVLAGLACMLLVLFNATTTRLIPLYALGVFLSFTLSQTGMVVHWRRFRDRGWRRAMIINALGGVTTFVVLTIILEAKFLAGAWVVVLLIPILAGVMWTIGRYYRHLRRAMNVPEAAVLNITPRGRSTTPIVVPVEDINLATVMTLGSACERSRTVIAVHVQVDPEEHSTVSERWAQQFPDIPLVVIDSPYRTVADPIALYVNELLREPPHEVTVMYPVLEVEHWWQRPLVNQSLKRLSSLLGHRRHVSVVTYPINPGRPPSRSKRVPL